MELVLARLNVNHLVALSALLDEASVTRAARRTGVTQGAMSQTLAQLRSLFGDRLLVRSGGGMVLTPRAERLAPRLRKALAELELAINDTSRFDPATSQAHLRIASEDVIGALILPQLLARVAAEAPGVRVDFVGPPAVGYAEALEVGAVDFAIEVALDMPAGIRDLALFPDDLVSVVRRDHPIGDVGLDLEAWASIPHILVGTGEGRVVSSVDRALAELGLARQVAVRVGYFMLAPQVVATTDFLWNGPRAVAELYARQLPLRILEIPVDLDRRTVGLYWHRRFEDDPAHRWLRRHIVQVGKAIR